MKFWETHALPSLKSGSASSETMHAMEKPHKMIMAIRLETQLSRICTWRHRVRCQTAAGGAIVTCACAWCARVRCARAIPGPSGVAGLTAATAPLPHETQRFNLAPAGERASMAWTCASEHSCGSPAVPMFVVLIQTRSTERVIVDRTAFSIPL